MSTKKVSQPSTTQKGGQNNKDAGLCKFLFSSSLENLLEYFHEKAIHQKSHGLMKLLTFETPDQDT